MIAKSSTILRNCIRIYCLYFIFNGVRSEKLSGKLPELDSRDEILSLDLFMSGYIPKKDDDYVCISVEVTEPGYIIEFMPTASAVRTHHILGYGCNEPAFAPGETWDCEHEAICKSPLKVLYAWARNAPPMSLPDGVGVPIGRSEGVGYIVLQVHYGKMFGGQVYDNSGVRFRIASQEPKYLAGIYLFASGDDSVPANTPAHYMNISCQYNGDVEVHPFAFRTHTHQLGRVVSAYKYDGNENEWTKIGKGNPQWPQRFYPVEKPLTIFPGDVLAAQCLYNSTGRRMPTSIGAHGHDEMCNFYMYYYVDARHKDPFKPSAVCGGNERSDLFAAYPSEASTLFASDQLLEKTATLGESKFVAVENSAWLSSDVSFGQIAGLAFDNKGNIVVFHRVDRVWNENTFDETNRFRERTSGPIMGDPILTVSMSGSVVSRWGRGFFYMPHGVFVDKNDFLWVTDVAMHQVFKFDTKQSASKPALALGTEFEPGVDERHFCKPAAVAVSGDGTIFVADGYCNNRIMKFNSNGVYVTSWGEATSEMLPSGYPKLGSFSLPHSLSLHDASKRLFVADRENARVQIFNYNGSVIGQLADGAFGATVYGVAYCEAVDVVYVLNGPSLTPTAETRIFAFDGSTKRLMYSWRPQSGAFQRPHALATSSDCSKIFVGETGPNKLWRFDVNSTGRRPSFNAVGKNFGDGGVRKPDTAGDADANRVSTAPQSMTQLVTVLSAAIAVPVLIIAAICLCIRFRKRGGFRAMNMTANYNRAKGNKKDGGRLPLLSGAFRDRNGFQRLSTEDVDAMDELSDESETEDTLYPVTHKNSTAPQKA